MSDHGYVAYTHGCRCDVCREAKRVYVSERRAAGVERDRAVPLPAWHDRATRNVSRVGLRRARLPHVRHGTTGYRLGCRCWDCTDASSRSARDREQRRATA